MGILETFEEPTYPISEEISELMMLLENDEALDNPVLADIEAVEASVGLEKSELQSLVGIDGTPVFPDESEISVDLLGVSTLDSTGEVLTDDNIVFDTEIQSLIDELESLEAMLQSFKTHTNKVSGKVITNTNPFGNFPTRLSIAISYHRIFNALYEDDLLVDKFSPIFTSIIGEGITLMSNTKAEIVGTVDSLEGQEGESQNVFDGKITTVQNIVPEIQALIDIDNSELNEAISFLIRFSLASTLHGSYSSDEFAQELINTYNGTAKLIEILES